MQRVKSLSGSLSFKNVCDDKCVHGICLSRNSFEILVSHFPPQPRGRHQPHLSKKPFSLAMFSGPLRVMFCLERAEKMKAVFSLGVRISFSKQQRFCESNGIQMWELAAVLSMWAMNSAGRSSLQCPSKCPGAPGRASTQVADGLGTGSGRHGPLVPWNLSCRRT